MTRFIVISKDNKPLLNNKENFSLIFTVKNEAGALAKAISIIGLNGFNMKAIRSRPVKSLAWNYYFFIEGEGDLSEGKGVSMLNELNVTCETVRVLGDYPEDILLD
jgi:prephenate dehydratase